MRGLTRVALSVAAVLATSTTAGWAQQRTANPTIELYGFAQADMIVDFKQNDPAWFDVNRPTKLPSSPDQFGRDGHTWFSVRQSRLGVRSTLPTSKGDVKATFEFDMFGVGADAGQTTIRLRHAFGQFGQFGAGQTNSPFMDGDVFPNSLDYWGPNGMLFFRNIQVFWRPIDGTNRMTIAAERPGASGDAGDYADRIELQNVRGRFPIPDFSAEYRVGRPWGYVEAAGIVRYIKYDDLLDDALDLDGSVWGWGLSLSSNVRASAKNVLRLQLIYGQGIQNYFNDAPVDVGIELNPGDPVTPIVGQALPIFGLVAFLDHTWNDRFSSAIGYSRVDIDNSDGQSADAYRSGQYALVNLLHYPAKNVMVGAELQYAHRENFEDGFKADDIRLQFSFKYSFAHAFSLGGK